MYLISNLGIDVAGYVLVILYIVISYPFLLNVLPPENQALSNNIMIFFEEITYPWWRSNEIVSDTIYFWTDLFDTISLEISH